MVCVSNLSLADEKGGSFVQQGEGSNAHAWWDLEYQKGTDTKRAERYEAQKVTQRRIKEAAVHYKDPNTQAHSTVHRREPKMMGRKAVTKRDPKAKATGAKGTEKKHIHVSGHFSLTQVPR